MSDADAALHHLFEANRLLRDAGERIAATVGQTHARRMVLQAAQAGATVPDIARRLGLHRQGVQRIADELVAEGLARYDENPRHRLSKRFIVTDLGHAALISIAEAHTTWITALETDTADIDWSRLGTDLARLVRALQDQT
jgi:DNA-binding IclR family transcriptional regulator